ncbi:EAL domain-containing protein [Vibrio sp. JPW-9-11-11]|uniref:bifunctional diguanylate cyclase/phosphodiesterase n=1 Tax=Vibrio sp. JPW-9-11-11 TaxID=1416532 RepID=UPI001594A9B5|nr:EAL domain-containing protein [Vibrio sp. JPW-9-11-11]NVD06866.1 EAL domain-containing protein [Vibrio sp. JPW-9-11-11]
MAFIKKNIWLAFYFITLVWTLVSAAAGYLSYQTTYKDVTSSQVNLTKLTANAFDASLTQYRTILDLVGTDLLRFDVEADIAHTQQLLDSTVSLNESILAVELYHLDGRPIISSTSGNKARLNNPLYRPQTRESFQQTLKTNKTVIGRTYYKSTLGELIIPFRKQMYGQDGNAKFVLSILVSLKKGFDYFYAYRDQGVGSDFDIYLYREEDRYYQIAPKDKIYQANSYRHQLRQSEVDLSVARLERKSGLDYEQIKSNSQVVVNQLENVERKTIGAATYVDNDKLWVVSEIKKSRVTESFLAKLPVIIGLYIVAISVMFFLFRSIANNERRKQQELSYQANHDYLTGIENRFCFEHHLSQLDRSRSFSLVLLNVDSFKLVNDNFGNHAGDVVLKRIAERLHQCVGKRCRLFRSGGDEFTIVTHLTEPQALTELCQDASEAFNEPFSYRGAEISLECTISVATSEECNRDIESVKRNVGLAMHYAKQTRSKLTFYQARFLEQYLEQHRIELELKQAIQRGELSMAYQPQINTQGELKGVEALVRWHNADLGFVPPDKFIHVAENCGYMPVLGDFILTQTLADMAQFKTHTGMKLDVAINVSVKQLQDYDFVETVKSELSRHQFDPHNLILEVTESVFAEDVDNLVMLLDDLKKHAIRISLDDFGTGYSSLSLLKHLPICEVKIDKSFVSDMLSSDKSYSMLAGVISLAKRLNMKTVAEGVESAEEVAVLRQLGCDMFQGYHFAKPMSLDDLYEFVEQRTQA